MIRIAFVKYAGLAAGGTERWLQTIAAHLPRNEFQVDYFYADSAPYIGSSEVVPGTEPARVQWMRERGVNLIEFHIEAVDVRRADKRWINTNFWEVFDPSRYDLVQTAKEGLPEYPYHQMELPVFEQVAYTSGVDRSSNTVRSGFCSQWHRGWWARRGGPLSRSFVIPVPAAPPAASGDLRGELGIDQEALVVGFHQRPSIGSYSPVQLEAVARTGRDIHVVVLGGSSAYRDQAHRLGLRRTHFLDATADEADISRFLNSLDVFVHGRRDGETFGAVLGEALAHAVPCLSHRVKEGGNAQHETIGPGGVVVDTCAEYAIELARMLDDPAWRLRLATEGQRHARARYSIAAAVDTMAAQYRAYRAGEPPVQDAGGLLPYGEEPGGMLLAGPLDERSHPAHAVLSGRVARPLAVKIAEAEGGGATVVDVGASRAYLALAAARRGGRGQIVHLGSGREEAALNVALNHLDGRVTVVDGEQWQPGEGPILLDVTAEPAATDWLRRNRTVLGGTVPVVLVEKDAGREVRPLLRDAGYRAHRFAAEPVYVHSSMSTSTVSRRLRWLAAFVLFERARRSTANVFVRCTETPRERLRGPVLSLVATARRRLISRRKA